MRNLIMTALFVLFSIGGLAVAADDVFEIETEGRYRMEAGASVYLTKNIALFNAKIKAIESAGRYLAHSRLIEIYELDKDEIYCLATREIPAEILMEKWETVDNHKIFRLRIRATIRPSDFIKAEMEDLSSIKKEAHESWQAELGQPVPAKLDPGRDIAKAYRLLRDKKWRMAAIYLNHLEKKYPNWDRIYMAKAIIHYICHDLVSMKKALTKACSSGNPVACNDLKNLKRVREQDFGLSIFE